MTNFCGIDFGTSNSTVAVTDGPRARLIALEDQSPTIPSAVFWPDDGAVEFGRVGIASYVRGDPGRLMRGLKSTLGSALIHETTRLGGRAVPFRTVLARFFQHMKSRLDAQPGTQASITRAILGRPVHFIDGDAAGDAAAQSTLADIAREAGFTDIAFQFEPIAAALHYEQTVTQEELVLIVDIGGGTSDFSVVRVGPDRAKRPDRASDILANDGIRVGGTDFDRLLSLAEVMPHLGFRATTGGAKGFMPRHYYIDLATWHRINALYTARTASDLKALRLQADRPELIDRMIRVVNTHAGHALAMRIEAAKIALSDADATRLTLSDLTGGPNPMTTRAAFEASVEDPVARIAGTIAAVLASAGIRPDQIGTVFMTGGSSGLPLLRAVVGKALPGVPIATGDMLGSVGAGLALQAARHF